MVYIWDSVPSTISDSGSQEKYGLPLTNKNLKLPVSHLQWDSWPENYDHFLLSDTNFFSLIAKDQEVRLKEQNNLSFILLKQGLTHFTQSQNHPTPVSQPL